MTRSAFASTADSRRKATATASPTLAALSLGMEQMLRDVGDEIDATGQILVGYLNAGKRVRGTMALLPATVSSQSRFDDAVRYAVTVELIHAGTLCHDDIVDRCQVRRGRPSINAAAGSRAAAMAGLFLIWRAYELIAAEREVRAAIAASAARVAEGQAEEMTDLWLEVPIERYLVRQRMKTSALFELAAWLGARAARLDGGATEAVVHHAGHLGLAFQLSDDLVDLLDQPAQGRPSGTDLREGVLTLPILIALSDLAVRQPLRTALNAVQARGDTAALESCRRMLLASGAIERAARMVDDTWGAALRSAEGVELAELRVGLIAHAERVRSASSVSILNSAEQLRC